MTVRRTLPLVSTGYAAAAAAAIPGPVAGAVLPGLVVAWVLFLLARRRRQKFAWPWSQQSRRWGVEVFSFRQGCLL